ncbi:MAG: hypothetical protein SFZ02_21925 [bacterium]|nr:hypothetical protein [bacterium]
MSQSDIEVVARRRTFIRVGLFLVIVGTMPLYLIGFVLWGTSPDPKAPTQLTQAPLTTPLGNNTATSTTRATLTLLPVSTLSPLGPTPGQFIPPPILVRTNTPPPVFIPTSTTAPTLTPFPTVTPFPTNTDLPVIPTFTPIPPASDTPLPPPSDTPPPPPEVTASP